VDDQLIFFSSKYEKKTTITDLIFEFIQNNLKKISIINKNLFNEQNRNAYLALKEHPYKQTVHNNINTLIKKLSNIYFFMQVLLYT
jgi:hypothetical protein